MRGGASCERAAQQVPQMRRPGAEKRFAQLQPLGCNALAEHVATAESVTHAREVAAAAHEEDEAPRQQQEREGPELRRDLPPRLLHKALPHP